MASSGIYLIDVLVDLDDLAAYCQQRGLPNTGSTRAEYAAHLLSQQGKQQVGRQIHPSSKPASKKKKHRKR